MSNPSKVFYAKTREDWRVWLKKNHKKEDKVGLIRYKKHTGKPSPIHREAREEAICFGWIDTTIKRIDDKKYVINFVKRSKNGRWSNNTLRYAKELEKQGKMFPAGLSAYKLGLSRPTHDFGIPVDPIIPSDLVEILSKTKTSKNFDSFSQSYKRTLLRWLFRAKLSETRKKRIDAIVNFAKNNNKKTKY